ncbi:hypothetical protein TNCV_1996381 [Trichonephila clavipes]|uniref:Uncharacterized protein n=1 Tax=Trichonephila clavipes TaxID=2585209 RepID=A0A8X6RSW4_TRICX|nr:hypothetical protein TNCV_1996381 [Trichonephila clavipes]
MAPRSCCMSGIHVVAEWHEHTTRLPWCRGSILGVKVYCRQWHPIPSHQLLEWCVAVKKDRNETLNTGSPHTNTIVITHEVESEFVANDDLVPFRCDPVSSCVVPLQMEMSVDGRQGQHT